MVCLVLAGPAVAVAAPAAPVADAAARQAQGERLYKTGQYDQALAVVDQGLAGAPAHLGLLELRAQILVKLPDYLGALEAYEADVRAGATGANLRNARANIARLGPVRTTFLDISVGNGPAVIHLDSRTQRVFCTAEPACHKGWLPGRYKVIAERPGYQLWTGRVTLVAGTTTALAITLVEKPSALTVRVAQAGARITVDDASYTAPVTLPAGHHRVTVELAGHVTAQHDVVAAEGKPIELAVALVPRVAIRVEPATAELRLDGEPVAIADAGLAVPPGRHVLAVRAPGFRDDKVEIPAVRPADYAIAVVLARAEPPRAAPPPGRFTPRRKLALAVGGVGVVAVGAGAFLGVQASQREDDAFALCPSPATPCAAAARANDLNKQGQARALQANVAYGLAAGAAITAAVLWLTGAPESRVAVTPRLGAVAGLDVTLPF